MKYQKAIFNEMLRRYNKYCRKLQRLEVTGRNDHRQGILRRHIERLFSRLSNAYLSIKRVTAVGAVVAMVAFAAPDANAQISFAAQNAQQTVPFGMADHGYKIKATTADLDNDGDLDVMLGSVYGDFRYYENTGTATIPSFAAAQSNPFSLVGLAEYRPVNSPKFVDLDNDGDFDLMIGSKSGNFYYFENVGTAASPSFAARQDNPFSLTPLPAPPYFSPYSSVEFADLDNDGDMDLLSGNRDGNFYYFENIGTAVAPAFAAVQTNPFSLIKVYAVSFPALADLDNDGDLDLLSGTAGQSFRYFENVGTAASPSFGPKQTNPFTLFSDYGFRPDFTDLDDDGDMDILSGWDYNGLIYSVNTTPLPIVDITPPVPDILPSLPDVNAQCSATPSAPTATDDIDGALSGTANTSFPIITQGTTVITWTYEDAAGNKSTQNQNVNITPVADVVGSGIDSNCDGQYTWYVDADGDTYGTTTTVTSANTSPGLGESANNLDFDDADTNKYPGAPCDDGNGCTIGEVYDANGNCISGLFADDGTQCGTGECQTGICVEPDTDGDGIPDSSDNCPSVSNADQADFDGDGAGDVCDADTDGDGVPDVSDNCPLVPNASQSDLDGDGAGDVCDADTDGDGVPDVSDNCPMVPNADQADFDGDGAGDVCDTDFDGDGIPDVSDNCPTVPNANQADADADAIGDACDACLGGNASGDVDGDGYCADYDCNDNDANVNPGATDVAGSGIDANCDGQYLWYIDNDGDGYGSTATVSSTNTSPGVGESATNDDCQDDAANTNPGELEIVDGIDNDCDGNADDGTDSDGDGYFAEHGDCDDTDANVNAGASDVAGSGIDANCDGNYLWYVDSDGDTYGSTATASSTNISPGVGESATGDDCDDGSALINPGVVDVAGSGIDANCDGQYLWYVDSDDDNYGSSSTIASANPTAGVGEAAMGDDCDDGNASINPDATDVTGSGVDANCDGQYAWFVDGDGDGHGSLILIISNNPSPGLGESAIDDDCNDTDADIYPGAPTLPDGKDNNCDGLLDKVDQTISFDELSDQTLGDDPFVLSATSSSGLAVNFSSASDKVQINSNLVTMVAAGRVNISANQPGDDSFNSADEVSRSFCVNPMKPTLSISGRNTAAPTLTSSSAEGNQWFLNGSVIAGAVDQSFNITGQGQYAVQVSADDCVSELSEIKVFIITGDRNPAEDADEILVYPNPVRDRLFVSLQGFSQTGQLEMGIYDHSGRLILNKQVRSGDIEEVDVRQYAAGKYLLRVVQDGKVVNRQFIKE